MALCPQFESDEDQTLGKVQHKAIQLIFKNFTYSDIFETVESRFPNLLKRCGQREGYKKLIISDQQFDNQIRDGN